MKRRTRRRIVRTLITAVTLGVIVALAGLHLRRRPDDASAQAAAAMRVRQLASCEERLRPMIHGEVEGWRLLDDRAGTQGRQFTFLANFNDKAALFHCEVDAMAMVISVDGPV